MVRSSGLKNDRISFAMLFGTLSNAAYRVSLRGTGAEIEGGSQEPPLSGGGKSKGPSGRGPKPISIQKPCLIYQMYL